MFALCNLIALCIVLSLLVVVLAATVYVARLDRAQRKINEPKVLAWQERIRERTSL